MWSISLANSGSIVDLSSYESFSEDERPLHRYTQRVQFPDTAKAQRFQFSNDPARACFRDRRRHHQVVPHLVECLLHRRRVVALSTVGLRDEALLELARSLLRVR